MAPHRELLARARLSVISGEPDRELDEIARDITGAVRVSGRAELEALLSSLSVACSEAGAVAPKSLDLIGHSTAGSGLLRLGDWVIDAGRPDVNAWLRELADRELLRLLGVRELRLLGCGTAATDDGRATILALAEILGIEVHGTRDVLWQAHYDEDGFRSCWEFLLTSASALRGATRATAPPPARPGPWQLDLDELPAAPLGPAPTGWPRRMIPRDLVEQIVALIDRGAGAPMPGIPLPPRCELAIPSTRAGHFHRAHVLLDGAFLGFFRDDAGHLRVAYPVRDADRLLEISGLPRCLAVGR